MNALKKEHRIQNGILDEDNVTDKPDQYYHMYFENKPEILEKCVYIAISETQILCRKYLSSRADTALLYTYRLQ